MSKFLPNIKKDIYPLANPKGVSYFCEMCGRNATQICKNCRVTYYCCIEHQKRDWECIHQYICVLVKSMKTCEESASIVMGNIKAQQIKNAARLEKMKSLLKLCESIARQFIFMRELPEDSIPAARQALQCNLEIVGSTNLAIIPSLLLLSSIYLNIKNMHEAKFYLAQGLQVLERFEGEVQDSIQSQWFRAASAISLVENNIPMAREYASRDIYYASREYGTMHYRATGGYFQLGISFEGSHIKTSYSLYTKITDIWMMYLTGLVEKRLSGLPPISFDPREQPIVIINLHDQENCFEHQEVFEAFNILKHILKTIGIREASHCLAMLYFLADNNDSAYSYGCSALLDIDLEDELSHPEYIRDAIRYLNHYRYDSS